MAHYSDDDQEDPRVEDRSSQVATKIHKLDQDLAVLKQRISELSGRLGPILRPDVMEKDVPDERESLVPLATILDELAHRSQHCTASLNSIIDRLEL